MRTLLALSTSTLALAAANTSAAPVFFFDLNDSDAATNVAAGLTVSDLDNTSGGGSNVGRYRTDGPPDTLDWFGGRNQAMDFAGAVSDGDFIGFTVTVDAGEQLDLTDATFDYWQNPPATGAQAPGGTPDNVVDFFGVAIFDGSTEIYRSSAVDVFDGIPEPDHPVFGVDSAVTPTISLAGSPTLTDTVEIRLYGWGGAPGNRSGGRMDDLEFNGAVTVIPEPTSVAAIAGLLVPLAARRRR